MNSRSLDDSPKSVLVIEGDLAVLRLVSRLLTPLHMRIETLLSTRDIDDALRASPDVVISGLRMPGQSGVEVMERAMRLTPHSMRLLLSGSLFALTTADVARLRPLYTIAKPFHGEGLTRELMAAWEEHRARLDAEIS